MLELGADVHQGGDGPLMRSALDTARIPVMELLIRHGADVNARWHGSYPIVCAPCEGPHPGVLRFLLDRGADPNTPSTAYGYPLDIAIGTYARTPDQHACVDMLVEARARGKYRDLPALSIHRGRLDLLARDLEADPGLLHRRWPEMDYGGTGGRRLDLRGATLLHVAAEFGEVEAARLLLDRGADANARAGVDASGVGGQTPIFHAATQYGDYGLDAARLLIERGADLALRCRLPGHYDKPDDLPEVTPLGYAARFPFGGLRGSATIELLAAAGAPAGDVYAAARVGLVQELLSLLRAGESPNACGPEGDSALRAALTTGQEEAARVLADAGADIGLPEACQLGAAQRVEALLRADPSLIAAAFGDQRWTAAFYAVDANRTDVLEVLDRFHCSWRARDEHTQRTPLHVAAARGHLESVRWLLGRGVPPDIRQWTGETPLHSAARAGAPHAIFEALAEHGADMTARAAAGTPLAVARRAGREDAAEWLRAHGGR
jgi:ankyrin repeat protein